MFKFPQGWHFTFDFNLVYCFVTNYLCLSLEPKRWYSSRYTRLSGITRRILKVRSDSGSINYSKKDFFINSEFVQNSENVSGHKINSPVFRLRPTLCRRSNKQDFFLLWFTMVLISHQKSVSSLLRCKELKHKFFSS